MINKLYSALIYGSRPIPEDFCKYRVHGNFNKNPDVLSGFISTEADPYLRAYLADAVIELSKRSSLFHYIADMDPQNTYEERTPDIVPSVVGTSLWNVVDRSALYPVLHISDIQLAPEQGVCLYSCNGVIETVSISAPTDDGIITIPVRDISIMVSVDGVQPDIRITGPVAIRYPNKDTVRKFSTRLPSSVRDEIDYSSPYDLSAAYCMELMS